MIVHSKVSFSIDGKTFNKGEHVLAPDVTDHWYFKALVSDGSISVLKDDVIIEAETVKAKEDDIEVEAKAETVEAPKRTRKKA